MLKDAIEKLIGMVPMPGPISVPAPLPAGYYAVREPDGKTVLQRAPQWPRAHVALSLAALLDFAAARAKKFESAPVTVWHGNGAVEVLLNDADDVDGRRDKVLFSMPYSPEWAFLRDEDGLFGLSQEEFIRALRTTLDGKTDDPGLLTFIRKLNFKRGDNTAQELQQGRASFEKQVLAEVTGAGDVPEHFYVNTTIYARKPVPEWKTARVKVVIDIDLVERSFTLIPSAEDMENAELSALTQMNDLIVAELSAREVGGRVSVYAGKP